MKSPTNIFSILLSVFFVYSCAHTPEQMAEERKNDYENSVENRISQMEDNIENLKNRESQLLGAPQEELSEAISNLEREVATSKAELSELKGRTDDTWIPKKNDVDRQLQEMEYAYGEALEVIAAD